MSAAAGAWRVRIGAVILVAASAAGPARAPARAGDLETCRGGDPQGAIAACTRLIGEAEADPGDTISAARIDALGRRAETYFHLRRYDRAASDAARASALAPDNANLYLLRGNIAYEAKDYAAAIGHYTTAIEHDRSLGAAFAGRGGARTYEGDLDGAFSDFAAAMALGFADAWTYNGRGNAFRAAGDLEHAYADYLHAAELDATKVDAWLNIGDLCLIRGDNDGARAAYRRAFNLKPEDRTDAISAAAGLGEALARLGRRQEALAAYELSFSRARPQEISAGQAYLAEKGHYGGPVDGIYGPPTRAALEACIADPDC